MNNDFEADRDDLSAELEHLFERDTETITFPDRIYALGGGGRKMVLEMFSQDWLVIEAMRNRSQDIDIVFMDSASENQENHAQEIAELQERLYELEQTMQEWTQPGVDVGSFTIQDEVITDHITVTNRASLTGTEPINEIKNHTDAESWWVHHEHLNAVDERGDFYDVSQGAVKRRALGKALHYKALAQGDQQYADAMQSNVEESQIALFTGLGGGTGSGTVIDVARKIRDHNQGASIQLFATLPASGQRDQAQANAFAALSELEYLSLSGETPFNDIFLFPLEPTSLDSETTDNPELREFDRAMTYAVLGVYNANDLDYALSNTTAYSPFTIVVPQILRYSRDEIKQKKDKIHELLETKREILNREYDNIERINEHLEAHHPNVTPASGTELSDDARSYIQTRLERFEQLLTSDLLEKLEIEITEERESLLTDMYGEELDTDTASIQEAVRHRGLDTIISDIEFNVDIKGIEDGRVDSYAEFGNDLITDIAHTELARIVRIYETLRLLAAAESDVLDSERAEINTDADTKLLETLLVPSHERSVRKKRFQTLKAETEDVSQEVADANKQLEKLDKKLAEERTAFNKEVDNLTHRFWDSLEPLIADYQYLSELNIDEKIRDLNTALSEYTGDLASESAVENVSQVPVQNALEELRRELKGDLHSDFAEDNQIEFQQFENNVREGLDQLKDAKRRWDKLESDANSGGFLGGLLGGNDKGTLETNQYRTLYEAVQATGVFELPRPPNTPQALERTDFTVEVKVDIADRFGGQAEKLRSKLREESCAVYKSLLQELDDSNEEFDDRGLGGASGIQAEANRVEKFERELKETPANKLDARIRTIVRDTVKSELDTEIEEYENREKDLRERLVALEARQNRLKESFELFDRLTGEISNPIWELFAAYDGSYQAGAFDIPHQRTKRHTIDQLYQHDVTPADLSSAVKKQSLAKTNLLSNTSAGQPSQERQDIRKSFSKITSNRILDSRYNGLKRARISNTNIASFEETGVYVAYASEALSQQESDGQLDPNDFTDVKQKLIENLDITDHSNQYDQWFVKNGDPWEVAMCVYIQGLPFLDNLRDLTANDGYWSRYQELAQGCDPTKTIERHAFGLERGFHVGRSKLVDVDGNPDFFLEKSREEIENELIGRHERVELQSELEPVPESESEQLEK